MCLVLGCCTARPQQTTVVVTTQTATTTTTTATTTSSVAPKKAENLPKPIIDRLNIQSEIQFRYSKTVIESRIKNPSTSSAQEVEFEMVLPEKAFISNFTIETKGKTYVSKVEKKENATQIFEDAVSSGQTAGLVDAREGNVFAIKTNVAAAEKLTFTLTYEQLLERKLSKYEQVINLNPGQLVKDMEINININESLPVIGVSVPELKQKSNELIENLEKNSIAIVSGENSKVVNITYKPSLDQQRELNAEGVNGQFIVQYDVDRKNQSSDIQVHDGYLVHFFVPDNNLEVLQKHVTFVLDTSGSMSGEKITQLQDAMVTILSDLKANDYFSIVEFDSSVKPWLSAEDGEIQSSKIEALSDSNSTELTIIEPPRPIYQASENMIEQAIDYAVGLEASGGTNINDALLEGIEVAKKGKEELSDKSTPMIIFLTDGQPTSGEINQEEIKKNIKKSNEAGIPVYGLAFGAGADFSLVKEISEDNRAFARKIFEGSDATIQLENFYAEISSPLLSNVTFDYVGEDLEVAENVLPGSTFNTGSEFISVVKLSDDKKLPSSISVSGLSIDRDFNDVIHPCFLLRGDSNSTTPSPPGLVPIRPCIPFSQPPIRTRPVNFIERLWAHLTIEKLLDDKADNGNLTEEERKNEATDIALKYNFVTDLTSLVVVKPAENDDSEKSVAKLTPVSSSRNGFPPRTFHAASFSFSAMSFSAPAPQSSIRRGRPRPNRTKIGLSKIALSRPGPQGGANRRGRPRPQAVPKIQNDVQAFLPPGFVPTTVAPSFTTTTYRPITTTMTTTTTTECIPADCKIELFPRTLLRETGVVVTDDTEDLADFDNKTESLRVTGNCQWQVWTDKSFAGVSQTFTPGEYRNAATVRKVLRKASSVKNLGC